MFGERSPVLKERLKDLDGFKTSSNEADLTAFVRENKIAWYVLRPEAKVSWPESFRKNFVFDCDKYRVYRFPVSSP
jgi:hypothetical protein